MIFMLSPLMLPCWEACHVGRGTLGQIMSTTWNQSWMVIAAVAWIFYTCVKRVVNRLDCQAGYQSAMCAAPMIFFKPSPLMLPCWEARHIGGGTMGQIMSTTWNQNWMVVAAAAWLFYMCVKRAANRLDCQAGYQSATCAIGLPFQGYRNTLATGCPFCHIWPYKGRPSGLLLFLTCVDFFIVGTHSCALSWSQSIWILLLCSFFE
jgi:hypothetical protein